MNKKIEARLNYLRKQIQNENISYGEIAELQSLTKYIDKGDLLLLQWAGVPEFEKEGLPDCEICKNAEQIIAVMILQIYNVTNRRTNFLGKIVY